MKARFLPDRTTQGGCGCPHQKWMIVFAQPDQWVDHSGGSDRGPPPHHSLIAKVLFGITYTPLTACVTTSSCCLGKAKMRPLLTVTIIHRPADGDGCCCLQPPSAAAAAACSLHLGTVSRKSLLNAVTQNILVAHWLHVPFFYVWYLKVVQGLAVEPPRGSSGFLPKICIWMHESGMLNCPEVWLAVQGAGVACLPGKLGLAQ